MNDKIRAEEYKKTLNGKDLLEIPGNCYGTWKILEGMNNSVLEYAEGKLEDIIEYAVTLPEFEWEEGSKGGKIISFKIIKIDSSNIKKRVEMLNKIYKMKNEMASLKKELLYLEEQYETIFGDE